MLTDVETRMPEHRKKPVRFAAEAVNCVRNVSPEYGNHIVYCTVTYIM